MLPVESKLAPGISLRPRVRGPIPDRNRRSPIRFACGNAPTGSGARVLSNVSLIFFLMAGHCCCCFFIGSSHVPSTCLMFVFPDDSQAFKTMGYSQRNKTLTVRRGKTL